MRPRRAPLLPLAAAAVAGLAAPLFGACATAPTPEAIRTFDRAERLATVCVRVYETKDGVRRVADPAPLADGACPNVPGGNDPASADAHVIAFVTQTARGELAAVDVSAAAILDLDRTTPGIDPAVAPALPVDVAASPDRQTIYVAGGAPGAYALYAAPTAALLGQAFKVGANPPPTLLSYRACALPSKPARVFPIAADPANPLASPGRVAVVLGGSRLDAAKVLILDGAPFAAGGSLPAGGIGACPIVASVDLPDDGAVLAAGAPWAEGLGYPGIAATPLPPAPAGCVTPAPGGGDAGVDGGAGGADGGASGADGGVPSGEGDAPRIADGVLDGGFLYLADQGGPRVQVVDLRDAAAPKILPPYVLRYALDPGRRGGVAGLAVSPATRTFERFLYAIDAVDGSVAVFDATDPTTAPRAPLERPHPEANPFQAPDRITFPAKAAHVTFARHDFPLTRDRLGNALPTPKTGVLCNPNPAATDDGVAYTANGNFSGATLGPARLRGVFAFVTLTNGEMTVVDVDDWDAPCRRPKDLRGAPAVSSITPPMPAGDGPYAAPLAADGVTTDEAYYPVSAPHRPRASYFLREDGTQGRRIPYLVSPPSLFLKDAQLPTLGADATRYPTILPTTSALRDIAQAATAAPAATLPGLDVPPGVRLASESPELQVDQDWTVTYEGALPGFDGLSGQLSTTDGHQSLVLTQPDALFCRRGVEDARAGRERASALTGLASYGTPSRDPAKVLGDYVQVTNDLLPASDPWWTDAILPTACQAALPGAPAARQAICQSTFGAAEDELLERDFPIVEAYDDHLVLGRFGYSDRARGLPARQIVGPDPSNAALLERARCCFQDRVSFRVRTGGSFVAVGSQSGYLHHVSRDGSGACVLSCTDRERLLSARSVPVPRPKAGVAPDRDAPLALRNPYFSYVTWEADPAAVPAGQSAAPGRDMTFRFQTRGGYSSLIYNLAAKTTAVSPRSVVWIEALGELAVVDGSSQGLILIDLATLSQARPQVN